MANESSTSEAQRRWREENPSTRYPLDYLIEPYVMNPVRSTIGVPTAVTLGVVALVAATAEIKSRRS
jgi:hypothetical protein